MEEVNLDVYKKLISAIVKKQIDVLGSKVAVDKANKIQGIVVSPDGEIAKLEGTPQAALQSLVNEYFQLSGEQALVFSAEAIRDLCREHPYLAIPQELKILIKKEP